MASGKKMMQKSIHNVYAEWISEELSGREDLVIDFSCLQMCLDPQSELSLSMETEGEKVHALTDDLQSPSLLHIVSAFSKVDYDKLLATCLLGNGEQVLPKLRSLRIRNCSEPGWQWLPGTV